MRQRLQQRGLQLGWWRLLYPNPLPHANRIANVHRDMSNPNCIADSHRIANVHRDMSNPNTNCIADRGVLCTGLPGLLARGRNVRQRMEQVSLQLGRWRLQLPAFPDSDRRAMCARMPGDLGRGQFLRHRL